MLKMGFKEDIETILGAANQDRQTVMFSATMPKPILNITKRYMKNPIHISVVSGDESNKDITQTYYNVSESNKVEAVGRLLTIYNSKLTLVFCNTKRKVDDVTQRLISKGYNVDKIHGDLPQTTRLDVLNKFHRGVLDILVATDVAARGLDIKNVEVVINFDVPEKAEYYVHRIGRTGRIGAKGLSFTFVTKKDARRLQDIIKFSKSTIKKRNIPTMEKVMAVKQEKEIEEITTLIQEDSTTAFKEFAQELLIQNDPVEVVSALLSKLAKNDSSKKIDGDINEDMSRSSRQRGPRDRFNSRGGKGIKRFHLNIGISDGITVQKFANFVAQKTNLRNSQIRDITVRQNFAFFSTDSIHEASVMKKMKNVKFQGKQTSIQLAKERKR
jgi:ATP-dependent RNA helicase DeaD